MTEKRHPNYPGELGTDSRLAEIRREKAEIEARARAIEVLQKEGVPFVVGGAYAFCSYTGIFRDTKDLDLFPRKRDALRALRVLSADGWRTERTDEVWIYKAFKGEYFVDLIFSSGNGIANVDDLWFEYAINGEAFGKPVKIAPVEEMIWSKAFVLERERFDGSDVMHLIKAAGDQMDWERLLMRFDRYWEVLLSHLLLFRFSYPSERTQVPDWIMHELMGRTLDTVRSGDWDARICRGTLLSRVNFFVDTTHWGYLDGREWDQHDRRRRGERRASGPELQDSSGSSR
jgi:hypothetical protein